MQVKPSDFKAEKHCQNEVQIHRSYATDRLFSSASEVHGETTCCELGRLLLIVLLLLTVLLDAVAAVVHYSQVVARLWHAELARLCQVFNRLSKHGPRLGHAVVRLAHEQRLAEHFSFNFLLC